MADVQHAGLTGADLHEPKDVATANDGEVYVADGAGGGTWQNPISHIEVSLDTDENTTRSFVGATDWVDFALTYNAAHNTNFTYNDTTKEIEYTGDHDIIVQYSFGASMERTDVSGAPKLSISVFEDVGAGFVLIPEAIVTRSFSSIDAGSMTIVGLHPMSKNDKFKLRVMTDSAIDINVINNNFVIHSIGLV